MSAASIVCIPLTSRDLGDSKFVMVKYGYLALLIPVGLVLSSVLLILMSMLAGVISFVFTAVIILLSGGLSFRANLEENKLYLVDYFCLGLFAITTEVSPLSDVRQILCVTSTPEGQKTKPMIWVERRGNPETKGLMHHRVFEDSDLLESLNHWLIKQQRKRNEQARFAFSVKVEEPPRQL